MQSLLCIDQGKDRRKIVSKIRAETLKRTRCEGNCISSGADARCENEIAGSGAHKARSRIQADRSRTASPRQERHRF